MAYRITGEEGMNINLRAIKQSVLKYIAILHCA